jgi:3-dehydroquinate synthase
LNKVIVNTASSKYPVFIGSNIFEDLPEFITKYSLSRRIFVIIDRNVERIYGAAIRKVIEAVAVKKYFWVAPASERLKSFKTIYRIFSYLFEEKFGRDTLYIVIGGGTIGDVAGFTASIYMRGVQLVHIPTTLLAAVDSSIGGKTGINFDEAKNLIGTFYHPALILIDTNFLKSLSENEMISGFGEIIKYSYLTDGDLYSTLLSEYGLLLRKDVNFLEKIIYESVKIKSAVVLKDEHEKTGLRKILNLGHTFAHAFESDSAYKLSHGKAVIAGIICSLFLSNELKLINKDKLNYMLQLPLKFKSLIKLKNIDEKEIFSLMRYDKKNRDGELKFVLIKDFGEILVDVSVDRKLILRSIREAKKILV